VLATIILFALLFTVGLGYFLYVSQGTQSMNQANANRQNAQVQAGQEGLLPRVVLVGSTFVVSLNNTGGAPVTVSSIYINDNTGKLITAVVGASPPGFMGQIGGTNATTKWPITLGVGQSTKSLAGCSCNIALSGYTYTPGTAVTVEIVTAKGNTFSAPYPPPGVSTTTSATIDSVTSSVTVSSIGNGANALVTKMVASPSHTLSCTACVDDTVTVYNYAASAVTGVTVSMNAPSVTGTAGLTLASACSPSPQSIGAYSGSGNPPSITFTCAYTPTTGAVGGFASFSGSATGTLTGVTISSAEAFSNSIQIGGSSNVPTQGAFTTNYFFFKYSACQSPPASTSNDFIFGATQTDSSSQNGWTSDAGFTAIANTNFFGSEYELVSSPQTNLVAGWSSGATPERESLADAITAAPGGVLTMDGNPGNPGFSGGQSSSTPTVTLSTTDSNDVVILIVETYGGSETQTAPTVSSVSGGGLTWTLRASVTESGGYSQDRLYEYYAIASAPLTSVVITATLSASSNYVNMNALGINGANTGSPFDPHSGLPATDNNAGDSGPTLSTGAAVPFEYSSPCTTAPSPMPPASLDSLADANYISAFSDYYVTYYVQVTNNFNTTLPLLEYSYLFMDPGISDEGFNFLVGTATSPQVPYFPNYCSGGGCGTNDVPTFTPYTATAATCAESAPSYSPPSPTTCIDVAPGQTVTLTFAACGFGASNWMWGGTSYAESFDNSGGCTNEPPGYQHDAPEGNTLAVVLSYLYKNQVYSQVMPFEAQDITSQRTTSTTLACSPSTVAVNVPTTCTVTVTDVSSGTPVTPTGTVTMSPGGGSCTLSGAGATASCTIPYTPSSGQEGADVLTATFPGDSVHSTSAGITTLTVTQRSDSVSVVCTPSSANPNIPTNCVITVTDTSAGTGITPTGTITMSQTPSSPAGAFTPAATCTLASGTCSVTFTPPANFSGMITITGSYGGDVDHSSNVGTEVVAWGRTTSTAVVCAPSTLAVGAPSTCTATVTDTGTGAPITPTGTITFTQSSPTLGTFGSGGTCTLSSGSCAVTFTPGSGQEGTITITASYPGDSSHLSSSGQASISATKSTTSTGISCPQTAPNFATTCTFTITDTSPGTHITPTGIVDTLSDGGAGGSFGATNCTLSSGVCTVTYTPHSSTTPVTISAKYEGDTDHATSTGSATLTVGLTFATVGPNSIVACVPVTLTNNQATATPTSFQQKIAVDSNNFNSYLASNVDNVNWQDGDGHILNSWLESGNGNTQSSTVYWVNLGSLTMAASGGTLTVYYCMYATAVNTLNTSNTGEAPDLTTTYAQYDDGASVFASYFNGNTATGSFTVTSGYTLAQVTGVTMPSGNTGHVLHVTGWSAGAYGAAGIPFVFNTGYGLQSSIVEAAAQLQSGSTGNAQGIAGILTSTTLSSSTNGIGVTMGYGSSYFSQEYLSSGTLGVDLNQQGSAVTSWVYGSVTYTGTASATWAGQVAPQLYSAVGGYSGTSSTQPITSGTTLYLSSLGATGGSGNPYNLYMNWQRARLYPPSGVMPSVSVGSLQQFAQVNGNSVTSCIPVTLTNGQSSATPASFQQMITVDSNTYNSNLASNLMNVNWQDGNGHILNSWLESGNSNAATSSVYWVNLGSNTIAASGGTLTIYYCMYGTAVNALNTSNTGEFPTATGTYGQYDDGASVFTDYWNFAGTSVPSGLSVASGASGTDYTFNNGLKLLTNTARIVSTATFNQNFVLEGYNDLTSNPTNGWVLGLYASSGNAYGMHTDQNPWGTTWYYNNGYNEISATGYAIPNYFIWQVVNNAGTITTNFDSPSYSPHFTATFSNGATGLPIMVGKRFDNAFSGQAMNDVFYWLRVRNLAPNNVMPSASFGSLSLFAKVSGNSVVACVPVTLTNSQSSATPANFQQMVTVNSNNYNAYLASNVDNVNWQDGNGNILNSWLESGNSNAATSSVYWVNLGGSSIAASGGTLTIYYCMYGTAVNALNTANTGEAPQLSGTYGQYDDGANVFTQYGGASWGSFTTVEGTWDATNGYLEQTASTGATHNGGTAALIESTSYPASGSYIIETAFQYTTQSSARVGLVAVSGLSSGDPLGYRFIGQQGSNGAGYVSFLNDEILWVANGNYAGATSTSYTMSIADNGGTWSGALYSGYGITGSSLATLPATVYTSNNDVASATGYVGISAGYYSGSNVVANPASFQWFRLRQLPPNNVMPSVSFGSLALGGLPIPFRGAPPASSSPVAGALSAVNDGAPGGMSASVTESRSPGLQVGGPLHNVLSLPSLGLRATYSSAALTSGLARSLRPPLARIPPTWTTRLAAAPRAQRYRIELTITK